MPRVARRTLLSVVLFSAFLFGNIETQAAEDLWVYRSCANWIQYYGLETVPDRVPIPVVRLKTCSPGRVRMACRLAATGSPVLGLKLCPDELCPTIGRALKGLGLAAMSQGQLLKVYRLCTQ